MRQEILYLGKRIVKKYTYSNHSIKCVITRKFAGFKNNYFSVARHFSLKNSKSRITQLIQLISRDQIIINARASRTWKGSGVKRKCIYDCPLNVCFGARINDVSDHQMRCPTVYGKKICVDDTTLSETVSKKDQSRIQESVDSASVGNFEYG